MNANMFVVEYPKNRGKGGAVRAGMTVAIGERILMVDADGATTFS
jgi:dolichyl-phosphate beta-glucosyltransferase